MAGAGAAVAVDAASRLAALERSGLVRRGHQTRPVGPDGAFPVAAELRGALPGGLPRGATVAVATAGSASTSLLLLLLAATSRAGGWCAVVGLPALSPIAAAEAGIALERLALVPEPGAECSRVAGILLDGVDVVVVAAAAAPSAAVCGRLSARARQRGSVLVPFGEWNGADLTLHAERGVWEGLGQGRGRVQCRQVSVVARGRGAAARPRRATMWLPKASGLYAQMQGWRSPGPEAARRLAVVPPLAAAADGADGQGGVDVARAGEGGSLRVEAAS